MSLSSSEARWRDALEASMKDFLSAYPAGAADELYDPIHYLLSLGGKRIRPVLALAACEAEGGALDARSSQSVRPRFLRQHCRLYLFGGFILLDLGLFGENVIPSSGSLGQTSSTPAGCE